MNADPFIQSVNIFFRKFETCPILIAVKGDDLARIFVNGEAVTDYRLSASGELDFRVLHLNKGWNRLMVKCANYSGDWSFIMKFNDAKNQLNFSTEDKTEFTNDEASYGCRIKV